MRPRIPASCRISLGPRPDEGLRRVVHPWGWGVNGIFSVLAPILSMAVSMTFGMTALLLAAIPVSLLASLLLPAPFAQAER